MRMSRRAELSRFAKALTSASFAARNSSACSRGVIAFHRSHTAPLKSRPGRSPPAAVACRPASVISAPPPRWLRTCATGHSDAPDSRARSSSSNPRTRAARSSWWERRAAIAESARPVTVGVPADGAVMILLGMSWRFGGLGGETGGDHSCAWSPVHTPCCGHWLGCSCHRGGS